MISTMCSGDRGRWRKGQVEQQEECALLAIDMALVINMPLVMIGVPLVINLALLSASAGRHEFRARIRR